METKRATQIQTSLEKKINREYRKAYKEMLAKLKAVTKDFQKQDKKNKKSMTDEEYKAWRAKVVRRAKWLVDMINSYTERLTEADLKVAESVRKALPEVYAEGRDYGTYQVEKAGKIDTNYTLTDPDAVESGVMGNYIKPRLDLPKDERWNRQKITSAITQGILQGEDMRKVAKRLREVTDMDRKASIRNARTWTGSAQEQGKDNAYHRARDMGCDVENIWISTIDMKTRHSHRKLDGERKSVDAKFSNGLRYPLDMQGAPSEVYNCRCRMGLVVKGVPFDMSDRVMDIGDLTYEEWKQGKEKQAKKPKTSGLTQNAKDGIFNIKEIASKYDPPVTALAVGKLKEIPSVDELIKKIGGEDRTIGSCVSLAYAYAGNKCGFDVTDYRGGTSTDMFSRINLEIRRGQMLKDANKIVSEQFNGFTSTNDALDKAEKTGKEYILTTGEHGAVVRYDLKHDGWQYLELQGGDDRDGWHRLNNDVLKHRFHVHRSRSALGIKLTQSATLVDIESLKNCGDFETFLSYINTAPEKQKKGTGGGIK